MDFKNYRLRLNELSIYEEEIRYCSDAGDYEKICKFLSVIDESVDYSLLGEKELHCILNEIAIKNMKYTNELISYSEFICLLNKLLDTFTENISTAVKPIVESLSREINTDGIAHALTGISQSLQTVIKSFIEAICEFDFKDSFGWIDDSIHIASEYEWVVLNNMDLSDLIRVLEIHKNDEYDICRKNELVDSIFLSYLTSDVIECIFSSLLMNERLVTMHHILREIRFAYKRQKYYLCCATLIPLVEGVVFDTFDGDVYCKKNKFMDRVNKLTKSKLSSIVLVILDVKLYSDFHYGQKLNSRISRNAILHGFDRKYGNRTTFCKILLLFKTLVEWLDDSVENAT